MREVDDLQAFFDVPPGSPAALTAAPTPRPAPRADTPAADEPTAPPPATPAGAHERVTARRIAVGLTTAAVVVVVGAVVAAALTDDEPRRDAPAGSAAGSATGPTSTRPTTTTPAAPLTAAAAGDLALSSVPLGDDGLSARLSFSGIVLEPRAVGATVTTPALSLTTDGDTGLVHLTLPTWNCLDPVAPADPAAAGCTPAPTEYADLATPDLRLTARDGEFEVSGDFATYTRPNGSAPAYTGRSYSVTVQAGPDDRFRDGAAPATGEFRLGGSSTPTSADVDLNVVETG